MNLCLLSALSQVFLMALCYCSFPGVIPSISLWQICLSSSHFGTICKYHVSLVQVSFRVSLIFWKLVHIEWKRERERKKGGNDESIGTSWMILLSGILNMLISQTWLSFFVELRLTYLHLNVFMYVSLIILPPSLFSCTFFYFLLLPSHSHPSPEKHVKKCIKNQNMQTKQSITKTNWGIER